MGRALGRETLQDLAKHQIPDDDLASAKDLALLPNVRRISAVQEVNPDTAVTAIKSSRALRGSVRDRHAKDTGRRRPRPPVAVEA